MSRSKMSHTSRIGDTVFIHNGDYSGKVMIVDKSGVSDIAIDAKEVEIPFADLRSFMVGIIRDSMVRKIEDMDDNEIIKHIAELDS